MHTIEFINTIKWLESLFSDDTRKYLFEGGLVDLLTDSSDSKRPDADLIQSLGFNATHEISSLADKLNSNPLALLVLGEFNLEVLADREWPVKFAKFLSKFSPDNPDTWKFLANSLSPVFDGWSHMTGCIIPLENLTIPTEISGQRDYDEYLTFDIPNSNGTGVKLLTVNKLLLYIQQLYSSVATAMGVEDHRSLNMVYASTSNSFRIDLAGTDGVILELKNVYVEIWKRNRPSYKEILRDNIVISLENLELYKNAKNTLPGDAFNALRTDMKESLYRLLDMGVKLRELKFLDRSRRQKMLARGPKLNMLPPPPAMERIEPPPNREMIEPARTVTDKEGQTKGKAKRNKRKSTKKKKSA